MSEDEPRVRLGAELRRLREEANLTVSGAGQLAGIRQPRLSKVELGVLRARPGDVRDLCRIYGVAPEVEERLAALAEELQAERFEPRRVTLSRGAAAMQARIRQLEASASLLRSYQPCMVLGLLQTEAYARLVFGVSSSGRDADRAVTARMERQQVLRERVPRAVLIMTEGALRWQAGSPALMAEQLQAISRASRAPNVRVGIISYDTPMTLFPRHGWHIYDDAAVIVGTETGTATVLDEGDIARYEKLFAQLESAAAFDGAARAVLDRIAADYQALP